MANPYLADTTAAAVTRPGIGSVGLLGTRFTMAEPTARLHCEAAVDRAMGIGAVRRPSLP